MKTLIRIAVLFVALVSIALKSYASDKTYVIVDGIEYVLYDDDYYNTHYAQIIVHKS